MDVVVNTVNILKSKGVKHRKFLAFLKTIDSKYSDVIYYSHIRWLSRGKFLKRFLMLIQDIDLFMKENYQEIPELSDIHWIRDLAFLVDITQHLNLLNLKLQGKSQLITEMAQHINLFQTKLHLWATQILNNNLTYFESLKEYGELDSMSLIAYSEILNELKSEFSERFQDIKSLNNDFQLFLNPYSINLELVKPELQIEVAELQFNTALNEIYEEKNLVDFYAS